MQCTVYINKLLFRSKDVVLFENTVNSKVRVTNGPVWKFM